MSDTRPARRPPHPRNQTEPVLLRLEPDQLEAISKAAKHLGLPRAAWMRTTLLQAARGVLREAP
jgi:uncharacterized protein (DUF1778 family)